MMTISPFVCRWFNSPMRVLLASQCGLVTVASLVIWGTLNGGLRQQAALLQEQWLREQASVAQWKKRTVLPAPSLSQPRSAVRSHPETGWEPDIKLPTEALSESGGRLISWSHLPADGGEDTEAGWLLAFITDYSGIQRFITRLNASQVVPRIDRLVLTRENEDIRAELLLQFPAFNTEKQP